MTECFLYLIVFLVFSLKLKEIFTTSKKSFTLSIFGVLQPTLQDFPVNKQIWIGIDQDEVISNGVYLQGQVTDSFPNQIQLVTLQLLQQSFKSNAIRTIQTLYLSAILSSSTMVNGGYIFVEFPYFFK